MINLKDFSQHLPYIKLKEKVPQLRSFSLEYSFNNGFNIILQDWTDFIIDTNYDLIIGQGHYKMNKKSDFLFGAGRLKINQLITDIDLDSGHYIPTVEDMKKIIHVFFLAKIACKVNLHVESQILCFDEKHFLY